MNIQSLPSDVLIILMNYFSTRDLAALSGTCRFLYTLVEEYGWKGYLRVNSRPSYSLHHSFSHWKEHSQVRYNTIADHHWSYAEFVARPLSQKWTGKLQPVLAINSSRLLVAAGNTIYSYVFTIAKPGRSPGIKLECLYTTSNQLQARRDITSLTSVADGGLDRTVYVGYADGAVEHITLPVCKIGMEGTSIDSSYRNRQHIYGSDPVESLSSAGDYVLSLSSAGTAVFFNRVALAKSEAPQTLELQTRSWSSHLSTHASTPYAVFGTSSTTPLVVHNIHTSHIASTPSAILAPSQSDDKPERPSAVYGISGTPSSAPWGASDQIVVSGWYDGVVRVHDMRSSVRASSKTDALDGPAPLRPVLSIYDPWTFEPIYSVACGGGNSSHVAAGTARHSVVALWDVRSPTQGWSVHAPGNDSSPVYSVILESSRVFGATQSRPFVLDFGTDVRDDTYPSLPRNHREDGLKRRDKTGVGFYVTKYSHARTREAEVLVRQRG